ncbi:MAG: hypothetical protein HUU08_12260 [Candidatus Brocadia sp.]|nr:hypothetical protein [Candidatus Brocadia sp.]
MSIIHKIREKIARQEYEFTIPHFFEEMANDNLVFADIEMAIAHGRIRRKFTRDPRGIVTRLLDLQQMEEKLQLFVGLKVQENYY